MSRVVTTATKRRVLIEVAQKSRQGGDMFLRHATRAKGGSLPGPGYTSGDLKAKTPIWASLIGHLAGRTRLSSQPPGAAMAAPQAEGAQLPTGRSFRSQRLYESSFSQHTSSAISLSIHMNHWTEQ